MPLKLSYSKLDTYKQCPQRYKFQYVDGIKVPFGKALIYGSFVHKVLEEIELVIKAQDGKVDSLPAIVKPIWLKVKSGKEAVGLDEADFARAKKSVQNYIFHLEQADLPTIVSVEEWFSVVVGDFEIRGKIDLITEEDGSLHVIDHKTTKLSSIKYLDDSKAQLQIYALAVSEMYDRPLEDIKSSFSLISADFDKKSYTFNQKDIDGVKDYIVKSGEAIKNDTTWEAKTNILCAWCSFYDMCEAPKDAKIVARRKKVVAEG